jgi:hypothetical protein
MASEIRVIRSTERRLVDALRMAHLRRGRAERRRRLRIQAPSRHHTLEQRDRG